MNFFQWNIIGDTTLYFLALNYTTEEDGQTRHWFLCLNNGHTHSFRSEHLRILEPIEYKDINDIETMETK